MTPHRMTYIQLSVSIDAATMQPVTTILKNVVGSRGYPVTRAQCTNGFRSVYPGGGSREGGLSVHAPNP